MQQRERKKSQALAESKREQQVQALVDTQGRRRRSTRLGSAAVGVGIGSAGGVGGVGVGGAAGGLAAAAMVRDRELGLVGSDVDRKVADLLVNQARKDARRTSMLVSSRNPTKVASRKASRTAGY